MSELQAVLLCGGMGTRMPELCSVPGSKCLLPIGGVPMFLYPLRTLIKASIKDIKIVVRKCAQQEVKRLLDVFDSCGANIEVIALNNDAEDVGTADAIRTVASKITKDFIVVSCDFIFDGSLSPMIEEFRSRRPLFSCLLSDRCVTGPFPGTKMKRSKGRDLIGLVEKSQRIVYLCAEDDYDQPVNMEPLSNAFPLVSLTARYNDCHVFFFRNSCLEILAKHKEMASLKADVVPFLLQQQYADDDTLNKDKACLYHVPPIENGALIAHANNLASYFEASKAMVRLLPLLWPKTKLLESKEIKKMESAIACSAKVGDGAQLKRSVVGDGCELSGSCRLQQSVVMSNVTIGQGASLNNSIVCSGAVIEPNADITNCIVVRNQKVAGETIRDETVEDDGEADWN